MDKDKRNELIKSIAILLLVIIIAAICARSLFKGETLLEYDANNHTNIESVDTP